jgi:hypothetical protein
MEYPSEILLDSGLFYEMEEMLATIVEVIGGSLKGREERDWTLEMLDALEPGIDVDQKTLIRKFSLLMLSEVGRQYGGEIGAALVRTAEMLEAEKVPSDWKSSLTELRSQVEQDGKGREDDPWVLLLTENLIDGDDMNAFYEVFDLDGINIKTAIADQMIAALRETSSSDG